MADPNDPKFPPISNSEKSHIRPIGDFFPHDADGYFVNPCRLELISTPFLPVLDAVRDLYCAYLGTRLHSLYVRGSIPRGTAVEGISDIDTFAIIFDSIEGADRDWLEATMTELEHRFTCTTGVELCFVSLPHLTEAGKPDVAIYKQLIQFQSLCLWGTNLAPTLPRCRPGPALFAHLFWIRADLAYARRTLGAGGAMVGSDDCRWIMKRLLRTGMELVMEREKRYSRDLYPCFEAFARHYPEQSGHMWRALEWAVQPSGETTKILSFINEFGEWLEFEVKQYYPLL